MFYVTKLNLEHTKLMNDHLYRLLGAISNHWNIDYMDHGVYIPTSPESADRYVLRGQYAIMDLLPRPKLYEIAGHVCFKIKDIIALHMALGHSIEFTVVPYP